jgi:hypothetical protein
MTPNHPHLSLRDVLALDGDEGATQLRNGRLLVPLLFKTAVQNKESIETLCANLKVTKGYLAQLENGVREPNSIGDDFARECAQYTGLPFVGVLILSGRMTFEDCGEMDGFAGTAMVAAFDVVRKFVVEKSCS